MPGFLDLAEAGLPDRLRSLADTSSAASSSAQDLHASEMTSGRFRSAAVRDGALRGLLGMAATPLGARHLAESRELEPSILLLCKTFQESRRGAQSNMKCDR